MASAQSAVSAAAGRTSDPLAFAVPSTPSGSVSPTTPTPATQELDASLGATVPGQYTINNRGNVDLSGTGLPPGLEYTPGFSWADNNIHLGINGVHVRSIDPTTDEIVMDDGRRLPGGRALQAYLYSPEYIGMARGYQNFYASHYGDNRADFAGTTYEAGPGEPLIDPNWVQSPNAGHNPPIIYAPSGGGSAAGADTGGDPILSRMGVQLTPTDPNNPLTAMTIAPDNSVDRVGLAQQSLQSTLENVLNPQFAADQRDLSRYAFGAGRGVSGMARTSQGDLLTRRNQQIADLTNQLLTGATTGSIEDMYRNLGIAQQQQAFQAGQQRDAFGQNLSLQQLLDAENQQAFQQAMQQYYYAGYIDDPAAFYQWLAMQQAAPIPGVGT